MISAPAIEEFPEQSIPGSYTWDVNVPSGTAVTFKITDGTGDVNYSAQVMVQPGTSTDCLAPAA